MKYIPTSPTAQNTLRAHLNRAYPAASREKRNPTVEEITKTLIPYLDATIEEIVRISRVFNDASREAMVDTTLLGHHIPKGTNVIMLGCGPDYFSKGFPIDDSLRSKSALGAKNQFGSWDPTDTEIFKPERWLTKEHDGNEVYNAMAGPLLSFGLGPRGCYGKRLAYLTMRIFVVLVIWNFELLPVPEEVNSFAGIDKLTTSPKQCYIRLRKVKI
jgi:cytochrome P450